MSYRSGSMVIQIALFLAIFIIALPVSAENVTTETTVAATETTVVPTETSVTTTQTTVVTTQTTAPPTQTTVATTQAATTTQTTVATTQTTTMVKTPTVTRTTAVVTTALPTTTVVATASTGDISVISSPAGASILIDGIYSGTTPRTVIGVPAGNHILRLSLSGYHDYEGSIYIVAGQTSQGYGTLQPIGGQVVSAAPTATGIVTVFVPVITATPVPTQEAGLLGNSGVIVAIIGVITALIAAGASIFTHVHQPPKKE